MSHVAAAETDAPPSAPGAAEIDEERPLGMDLPRRVKALVMAGSALAMFLAALEQSIVNPAMPRIVSELGGLELYPWLVQGFVIAQITAIPAAGALSDSLGRKPLLLAGLLIFLGGSAGCGAANDIYMLIAFRALQGVGAGVLMMATFSVIGDLFPPSDRGRYMGLFAAVFALSSVIGAPLGGVLTEQLSWRWVFWAMFVVGPPALLMIAWKMPWLRPQRQGPLQFDWLGMAALLPMLIGLTMAFSLTGSSGWTSPLVLALFAVAGVSLVLFIAAERRAAAPIVPLHLFRINTVASVAIAMFVIGVGMMGAMVYLQVFLQVGLGAPPTTSGMMMIPMIVTGMVFAVVCGQIMSRTGRYKFLAVTGSLLMVAGMALLATMTRETPVFSGVLPRLFVFGVGMGMMMPVLSLAAQNAAPQRYLGRISGFTQFFQLTGGAVGIGIIGALFNARLSDGLQAALPADLVNVVLPEKLVDPDFRSDMIASIGATLWETVEPAVQGVVAGAITDNFLMVLGILGFAVLVILRMREVPLRTGEEGRIAAAARAADEPPPALSPVAEPIAAVVEPSPQPIANGATVEPVPAPVQPPVVIEESIAPAQLEAPVPIPNGARPMPNGAQPRAAQWGPGRGVAAAAFVGASVGLALTYGWSGNGRFGGRRRGAGRWGR